MTPHLNRCAAASIAALALSTPIWAEDVPRTPVQDARDLLLTALRSSDGQAHGVLSGDMADTITRRFAASSPIFIDVTTVRRYRQPGCSRLKLLFRQEGVRLSDSTSPRQQTIEFGINYCLDGLPPKSLL